mmetsp:Transcript_8432/g.26266  ORF Transcript_8432/g.26266 Transcript_8432/m.26266 type:complete len:628 (-) Transcript_8432:286-2169(-)
MLEYDDSAFYYFMLTMLVFYVVPATWWAVRYVARAFLAGRSSERARTAIEQQKLKALEEETAPVKVLSSFYFIGNLALLSVGWMATLYLGYLVAFDGELMRFDPFAILRIDETADEKVIRKAYRRLSLIYHPDKNPNNQTAEEMFIKVTEAYQALTDPIAIENMKKYGNINGHQALKVSFGLPEFLLEQKNHYAILVVYLVVLVGVVPAVVGAWVMRSQKYGDNNIMYDTYRFFLHALSEHSTVKMLPEVLAGAAENRATSATEVSVSPKLRAAMHKPRFDHPMIVPINALVHAHLLRLANRELYETVRADPAAHKILDKVLARAPKLCEAMLQIAQSQRWLQTCLNIIDFQQYLTQALWMKDNQLAQLPHFGPAELSHAAKGKGACKSLRDYVAAPDDQKKGIASLDDAKRLDVLRVCNEVVPRLSNVDCKFYVEDEAEIAEHDLVTLRVSFDRAFPAAPVHAPYFPVVKQETWWVVVSNGNSLVLAEKLVDPAKRVDFRVKLLAPPTAGTYTFTVDIKSADYLGLDLKKTVHMKVVSADTLPEYKPHQDDLDLDDEPTLFEQVMSTALDDSSEDDEPEANQDKPNDDDDDDDDVQPVAVTTAERRRRQARLKRRKARQQQQKDHD